MDRRKELVHYTAGMLEQPTPRVVSMLRNSPYSGREEGINLKQDIVSTLTFINNELKTYKRMSLASMKLATTISQTYLDETLQLQHRYNEVSILCQIQRVKRESLKYNSELQRTYQHGTINNMNIKSKIVRPEHFERGTPHTRKQALNNKAKAKYPTKTSLVNNMKGITAPWEGSQFKFELLCSLKAKLVKKLILSVFRCYLRMQRNNKQCISTCNRGRLKRLMQLCFSALLFEALSGKYIVFAAQNTTRKLLIRKYMLPSLHILQRAAHTSLHFKSLQVRASALYRKRMRRSGFLLLHWNQKYMQHSRVCTKWSIKHSGQQVILKAFSAWVGSFVEKNKLRQQIYDRYNNSNINTNDRSGSNNSVNNLSRNMHTTPLKHHNTSYFATTTTRNHTIHTPTNTSTNMDTPLKRVLEQTPLQNMRTAVSFFIQQHATLQNNANQLNTILNTTPLTRANTTAFSTPSEDESVDFFGTNVSKSCQKTLNTHSKRSIFELRSQLNATTSKTDYNNLYNGLNNHIQLNHTSTPSNTSPTHTTTTTPMLHNNMREMLRNCIQAKQLFPQARFDNTEFGSTYNTHSNNARHTDTLRHSSGSGSDNNQGVYNTFSDSENSMNNANIPHSPTANKISEKWKHRHYKSNSYMQHSSSSGSDYNNIEDLLLNNFSTTNTTNTKNTNPTTGRPGVNTVLHNGGLMDRAIHESFILSPCKQSSHKNTRTNTTNNAHVTPYFTHPTSSGTFCGQVEVDSDIEIELSDPSKQSLYQNNSHSSVYNSTSLPLMVHRRFISQIQGAFQMIKFRWLVKSCRRFVRTLHRQAKLHKNAFMLHAQHNKHTRAKCMRFWRALYAKHTTSHDLCARIYGIKLLRRILREWKNRSIQRLIPAFTRTYTLTYTNKTAHIFRTWILFHQQRMYQGRVNRILSHTKKVRIFAHWRMYNSMVKRSRHIHLIMSRKVLSPVFRQWQTKYKQRLLLNRVFTVHDQAWDHRLYTIPSPFQRLHAVLTAWKEHTAKCLRIRLHESHGRQALFFRGVSLMATHFHCWVDFTNNCKEVRRESVVQRKEVVKRCFAVWTQHLKQHKRQLRAAQHRILVHSPLQRIIQYWHHYTHHQCKHTPLRHHHQATLRKVFNIIRFLRPLRRCEEKCVGAHRRSRLSISLKAWQSMIVRTARYTQGLHLLQLRYYQAKLKRAFFGWPGRREILLSRQMCEYLKNKHRERIRLVEQSHDNPTIATPLPTVSFLSKKRPTLAKRALQHRYILHLADLKGIHYYTTLMSTILHMWSCSVKTDVKLRYRGFLVRHALQQRNVRKFMFHWVLCTPKTSYRRVVWMNKGIYKHHDEYRYQKQQKLIFDTAVHERKKSVKVLNVDAFITNTNAINKDVNSTGNGDMCGKYEGEYYTDESDCESEEPLHKVVWV